MDICAESGDCVSDISEFSFYDSDHDDVSNCLDMSDEIVLVEGLGKYTCLCRTRDDAAGEAFDKSANLLELQYPGGPRLAAHEAMASYMSSTAFTSAGEPHVLCVGGLCRQNA